MTKRTRVGRIATAEGYESTPAGQSATATVPAQQCSYIVHNGHRCRRMTKAGQLCSNHDPALKAKRKRGGRRSRRKGSTFERQVANDLKPIFGGGIKRGLAQSRFGAGEAPDVDGVPALWLETKHGKLVNLRAALAQATGAMAAAARPGDRWPAAVCKDDRKEPVVVMRWGDLLELLSEWHTSRS